MGRSPQRVSPCSPCSRRTRHSSRPSRSPCTSRGATHRVTPIALPCAPRFRPRLGASRSRRPSLGSASVTMTATTTRKPVTATTTAMPTLASAPQFSRPRACSLAMRLPLTRMPRPSAAVPWTMERPSAVTMTQTTTTRRGKRRADTTSVTPRRPPTTMVSCRAPTTMASCRAKKTSATGRQTTTSSTKTMARAVPLTPTTSPFPTTTRVPISSMTRQTRAVRSTPIRARRNRGQPTSHLVPSSGSPRRSHGASRCRRSSPRKTSAGCSASRSCPTQSPAEAWRSRCSAGGSARRGSSTTSRPPAAALSPWTMPTARCSRPTVVRKRRQSSRTGSTTPCRCCRSRRTWWMRRASFFCSRTPSSA
mmetsp:Transcript_10489/g.32564  ORF Transcript_10489/g.32564 Transcript_10489/m.32564 type:complete len:364 (-) Transcript_10489:2125-3216(-)